MPYEQQPNGAPSKAYPRDLSPDLTAGRFGPESRQAAAVASLQLAAAQLHDFFRFGPREAAEELDCFLAESGAGRPAEILLTDLAEAVSQLGVPEWGQS